MSNFLKQSIVLGISIFGIVEIILLTLSINGFSLLELLFIPFLAGLAFLVLPSVMIREKIIVRHPNKAAILLFLLSLLVYTLFDILFYFVVPELSEDFIVELNHLNEIVEPNQVTVPQSLINLIFTIGLAAFGVIIIRQKKILKKTKQ